jgi:hypothetical protein
LQKQLTVKQRLSRSQGVRNRHRGAGGVLLAPHGGLGRRKIALDLPFLVRL